MKILITGGAGFVGSSLALKLKEEFPAAEILAFDNLRRRGSEINIERFKQHGIKFLHGDIRSAHDFDDLRSQNFDLLIEASAEPSVLAGLDGSPNYLMETNLFGTFNCLEFAQKHVGFTIFLSTSRVYSLAPLKNMGLTEKETRFALDQHQTITGCSEHGVSESFPVDQARSLYGMTKLASEYMLQEYVYSFGMKGVINRCGVIVGPGQFGKVDQGVFTMWMANHFYGRPLKYIGFDGCGKQVRDLLHPDDLFDAIKIQFNASNAVSGRTYNLGGGLPVSTSLFELTQLCQNITGASVAIEKIPQTTSVDIPVYISDCRKFGQEFGWAPSRTPKKIMTDIHDWLVKNRETLRPIFAP